MTVAPDFESFAPAELFVLARLVQLRECGFGPFVPTWVVELPLAQPPYGLEVSAQTDILVRLAELGLLDVSEEQVEGKPPESDSEDGSAREPVAQADSSRSDEESESEGPVGAVSESTDEAPSDESSDAPLLLAATDRCMDFAGLLTAEIRRRDPGLPTDLPALLLLADANRAPAGLEAGDIRNALEEPPSALSSTDGLARYRELMNEHWIFACDRPETPTEWFPAPRCWAHRDSIEAALAGRQSEMRERLAAALSDSLGLAEECPIRVALAAIDRAHFVPEDWRHAAYRNRPVPIWSSERDSFSVTTSSPGVCALIASTLEVAPGDRVLVCGVKGGFTAALCAHAVGPRGRVVCLEDRAEVVELARASIDRAGLGRRIEIRLVRDVTVGIEDHEPWDAVVVNGKIPKVPRPIIRQMREGGRMLLFVQNVDDHAQTAYLVRKNGSAVENRAMSTFLFTPIYGEFGFDHPNWTENLSLVGQEGHDVFVSYSTRDQVECDRIVAALEASGLRCWQSARDHPVGKDGYESAIMEALRGAQLVLIVLSHESVRSVHVQNELTNATNLRKPMLPVKLEECPMRLPANFQYHLERYQQFDVMEHSLEKVAGAALTLLGGRAHDCRRHGDDFDPGALDATLEFVLRDHRITKAEMQLLLEEARGKWSPLSAEECRRRIEARARQHDPSAIIDA